MIASTLCCRANFCPTNPIRDWRARLRYWRSATMTIFELMLGLGVGLALGLTGGGGMLAVPALVVGLNYSMQDAMPVALIAISIAAFMGALDGLRRKIVRYKAAILMALAGIACAPAGIWFAQSVPLAVLVYLFASLLLCVSIRMAMQALALRTGSNVSQQLNKACQINPDTGRFYWCSKSVATFGGIGGVSGMLTGMLGVGGGFLIVPSLRQFSDLSINSTIATSLAVIAMVSAGTVTLVISQGVVIPATGVYFILSAIGGMLLARSLASLMPEQYLQLAFALVAIVAACMLIYDQLASASGI